MHSIHTLGFKEVAVDMTNSWLSNCRKQFWGSSFNYIVVLGWTFRGFILEEATWEQVEGKLGSIIFSHLFNGRLEIGKAIREGFYLAVEHENTSVPEKQRMTKSLDALTADTLWVIFTAKNAMEATEFLAMCNSLAQFLHIWKTCLEHVLMKWRTTNDLTCCFHHGERVLWRQGGQYWIPW